MTFPHSSHPRTTRAVAILLLVLFGGWGSTGHKIINRSAPSNLPVAMAGFLARAQMLADSASNADTRKSSDPNAYYYANKHFIDLDAYPECAARTIPHSLDSLILKYGITTVNTNGTNPWATVAMVDSLTAQMMRNDWDRVWSTAADLGHYVGDAHQPFHCTKNYDGQFTGNNGIHSRYETTMINQYQSSIVPVVGQATYIARPIDYVFDYMYESLTYVDTILKADTYAKQITGSTSSSAYYAALWNATGAITVRQFQRAVDAMADLLYTAWVNANRPPVPALTSAGPLASLPDGYGLEDAYPNPFNPQTVIRYRIPGLSGQLSAVSVKVYDMTGKEVATLVDGERAAGTYRVVWNAAGQASGVYFCRLSVLPAAGRDLVSSNGGDGRAGSFAQTKRMLLLK